MTGGRSAATWARRIAAVGIGCAVLLTTAARPAAAAPAVPDTTTGDGAAAPRVDNTKWPATLNWVIPGTPEFTARYEAGDTAGGVPVIAGTGCTAAHGGDAYRYTVDFFTNLGAILDAQATATGRYAGFRGCRRSRPGRGRQQQHAPDAHRGDASGPRG